MKKVVFTIFAVVIVLFALNVVVGWRLVATAQENSTLPPAIVSFTSDLPSVSLEALEAGSVEVTLTWQTVGLTTGFSLRLDSLVINDWVSMTSQILPESGAARLPARPTLDFAPPTYRLSIVNRDAQQVAQAIVTIPFSVPADAAPTIAAFSSTATDVDFVDLAGGEARVPVTWRVTGRTPTSNLVFEQILPNGDAVSVELPRLTRWIASSGNGVVAPRLTDNTMASVALRMRLVDLRDGRVLSEASLNLPVQRVGGTVVPTQAGLPTFSPTLSLATATPGG